MQSPPKPAVFESDLAPLLSAFVAEKQRFGFKYNSILATIAMTTKQKILSKDIWVRTAETQPFFAFLSIIQNFSLGVVVIRR